jgi:UDP-GlcNAc:undecaprenyl-phosphate/decaprenyl-phosphate GlcNAc-1-phosphate transferase
VSEGGWGFYASVFAASAVLSLVFTPLAIKLAVQRGILDHPREHKAHESPVPYLGGLALVGAFSLAVLVAAFVRPPVSGRGELVVVLAIGLGLSVIGLLDDLRGLNAWPRILSEVVAGIGLYAVGAGVELFQSDIANAVITVAWVVGIINAFNLLDNMDGLSAGVAAIGAGAILVIAAIEGQFLVAGLAAGTAGCALGFLRHNFHPARIYMGDCGSLFLGFLLAYLGMKLRFDEPISVTFLVPIIVLGVAIFDTTLVTLCRLAHRLSPFQGGRDHVSHRLVAVGVPVPAAVALIYVAAVTLGGVGLVVSRIDRPNAYILAGIAAALCLFLGALLARVPVYGDQTRARRVQAVPGPSLSGAASSSTSTVSTAAPARRRSFPRSPDAGSYGVERPLRAFD